MTMFRPLDYALPPIHGVFFFNVRLCIYEFKLSLTERDLTLLKIIFFRKVF